MGEGRTKVCRLLDAGMGGVYGVCMNHVRIAYRINSRIVGTSNWEDEGSGDMWDTRAEAERAIAGLETENDDGEALEYRVFEVQS